MKTHPLLIPMLSILLVFTSSCGNNATHRQQHDITAIPCKDRHGRAYYMDFNGQWLESLSASLDALEPGRWWEPGFFQDGLLRVDIRRNNKRLCLFLDIEGKTVLDVYETVFKRLFADRKPESAKCTDFSQGIAFVKDGSLLPHTYAINKKGEVVFEMDGIPLTGFNEKGEAFFRTPSGEIGVISTTGKVLMKPNEHILPYNDNLPPIDGMVNFRFGDRIGLMKFDGTSPTGPISAQLLLPDQNGCTVIYDSEKRSWGIATTEGKVLCMTDYSQLKNDGELYHFLSSDEQVGWCDKNGKTVIGPLSENPSQARRSRVSEFPQPFYGSKWSVGTITSVGEDRNYIYTSGSMTADDLKKMAGTYDLLSNVYATESGVTICPVINGKTMILNRYGKAKVYAMESGQLKELGDEPFYPKYGYEYFHVYARYALNPVSLWQGF